MKLKQILSVCAVAGLVLSSAAAYEAKAKITMEGSLVSQSKEKAADSSTYEIFKLDAMPSTSKNGIQIDFNGGVAGASFKLFYVIDGASKAEDGWPVSAKGTNLWFKPIDQIKLKIGYVGTDYFFVERIDEENVGNPFALSARGKDDGVPEYITNADVDGMGFYLATQPIEGLVLSAAVAPGVDTSFITKKKTATYTSWGATAEYSWNDFRFQASYADNGKQSWKVARAGVGYESDDVYAFIQPVFGVEYDSASKKYNLGGICADIYGEYTVLDALKFTAHLPLTFRFTGAADDSSYLEYLVKSEYNFGSFGLLDDLTPYVQVNSLEALAFDKAGDTFSMNAQAGTSFSVGCCKADVGFALKVNSKTSDLETITWSVPFSVKVEM